ncbi:MAG: type III-B CRISPR module-associated Cmr3 family protein [Myxococcota bacterium]
MTMQIWTIEPRDTLVVRDGRPFGAGATALRSLDFPLPSTVAGCLRTRIGRDALGRFNLTPEAARQIPVVGPWLAELSDKGALLDWWFPAPRDVVWFEGGARYRLTTQAKPALSNSPLGQIVTPAVTLPRSKPVAGPSFWRGSDLLAWLRAPSDDTVGSDFGLAPLQHERRTHVSIQAQTGTGEDGRLFSTDGLRFHTPKEQGSRRLALAMACPHAGLKEGLVPLGGEARLSFLRKSAGEPLGVVKPAPAARRLRVLLLTPAIFERGYAPTRIAGAPVAAAAVGRPQTVSGWDFSARPGSPKPSRRLAPAGSVYWVDLPEGVDAAKWADDLWFTCISDNPQDCLDGFGLCVVGGA